MRQSKSHPIRNLLILTLAFVGGLECFQLFRFTLPVLNYAFRWAVLCIPFVSLRPVAQLSRIPKVIGFVLVSPLLLFSLLMILASVSCDFDLRPYSKNSCLQELDRIEKDGYSVHLIRDGCGGAMVSFSLSIEQRRQLLPGLYVFRSIDFFDNAYEGTIVSVGENQIHIHVPKGVEGSGWNREVDRTYMLKPHVYF